MFHKKLRADWCKKWYKIRHLLLQTKSPAPTPAISFENNLQPTTVMLSWPKSIMQIVHSGFYRFRLLQIPAFTIPGFTDSGFYNSGFYRFRLLQFRVLQIPAFTIPGFTDSGFYNSGFYRFRLLQFRVLQIPAFTIPGFRIPHSIPHSIP